MFSVFAGALLNVVGLDKDDAIPRIISFAQRQDGWKYGAGKRPCLNTIAAALSSSDLLDRLHCAHTGAFLNDDGGILVAGYYDGWHVEIVCHPDGTYDVNVHLSGSDVYEESFSSFDQVRLAVSEQVRKWMGATSSSEFSTLTTSTNGYSVSKAVQSQNQQRTEASRSSAHSVLSGLVALTASTRGLQSPQYAATLLSFGSSSGPIFRLTHG